MKKTMAFYPNGMQTRAFTEFHENETRKAEESETKLLESLVAQAKQPKQTKISMEESKLEIDSLHESIKILPLGKKDADEVDDLKNELKLALQAEEQSKKAMDVLALTLIEVCNDSNQAKAKLSFTEEKLREAVEETKRLKQEAEKEMREIGEDNKRLMESNRASREEISKLREILKQAVNEANAVKEELEIARTENRLIKDLVQEKDDALNVLKQEFESLKVSEAAATGSVKELKALVAATSSTERWRMVEKPMVARTRRQNSWGEMEGFERIEGGAGSPLVRGGKEGKGVGFESRRLKMEDGKFEWSKEKKKKQFLRSFSDILRKSCQR